MTDPFSNDELLAVFGRVCADSDWKLRESPNLRVSDADVARQMAEQLAAWRAIDGPPADESEEDRVQRIKRAAVNVYCRLLHRALLMEGSPEQDRSLLEIYAHALRAARLRLKDGQQADAAANGALLAVWRSKETIRNPGALLSFAAITAGREAQRLFRQDAKYVLAPDEEDPDSPDDDPPGKWSAQESDDPQAHTDEKDRVSDLERTVRRCLRSLAQQEVFILHVLRGLSIAQVAKRMGITPNYVSQLKKRAISGLRKCGWILTLAAQWLAKPKGTAGHAG